MTTRIQDGSLIPESLLNDLVDGDGYPVNLTQVKDSNEKIAQVPYNDTTNRIKVIRATPSERVYTISIQVQQEQPQQVQAKRAK